MGLKFSVRIVNVLKLHVLMPKMNILWRTFHKLHKDVNMFPIIIRSKECHHILVWRQHWPYLDFVLFEIFTQNLIVNKEWQSIPDNDCLE